jgi:hypothetical protein
VRLRWSLVVLLVLLLPACGDDGGGGDDDTTAATTTSTAATPSTTATTGTTGTTPGSTPATDVNAAVYFARDGKVATAGRAVEPPAVAQGAIEALLAGPDDAEADVGLTSAIPADTRLLGISVQDGLATVDLSGEFLNDLAGDTAVRVAQVVFTLTQFPTVDRVTIQLETITAPSLGPEAVPAEGVDRSDFTDQTPFVLVESPTPGQAVTSPVHVTGTSNTFEATVNYEVVDADGTVLDEGATTATAGTGTWGTFDFTTGDVADGPVVLRAFQASAQDGHPTDVYEVPITVG